MIYERLVGKPQTQSDILLLLSSRRERDLWPTSCCPNRSREKKIVFSEAEITGQLSRTEYERLIPKGPDAGARMNSYCQQLESSVILTSCIERSNLICQTTDAITVNCQPLEITRKKWRKKKAVK